ncbi:MAG: LysM peptidoglycan-binding domain-containing protein [Planctomycetota bacterium]|nr:MAG: LysM peptidoglycan-binding domain-containing protein [Planctomycetota bacterium]
MLQNSTKVMLVAVLFLVVIIAIVWDRQNEKIKDGEIISPIRLPQELVGAAEPEEAPQIEDVSVRGAIGSGEQLPGPPPRFTDGGFAFAPPAETEGGAAPPVEEPPLPPEPLKKHKVQRGESFWSIAEKFYKDGTKWRKIFEANKEKVPTPERLRAKMTIIIPKLDSPATAAREASANNVEPAAPGGRAVHVVVKGETLSQIARRYYGRPDYKPILRANAALISDKNRLKVGIRLVIPKREGE